MSDDKTEEPTDKKIEDARKRGQVPVSRDLARLVTLVAIAEIAFATEPLWRESVQSLMTFGIASVGQPFLPALGEITASAAILLLIVFAVCFVVCIVCAVAGHWGQFGILISPESVTPKFDKLNPMNGIKQIFSKKKLIELLITVGKAALIGWMVYVLARAELPNIVRLAGGEPKDAYTGFIQLLRGIFHTVIVICLILAVIDFAVQKHFHRKELMMDMEEIKREYKESEGDPMIKGQRKQLARQWANEAPAARTEDANAVVVNPTHFAVALFYDPNEAMVPLVLAKGRDDTAQAMIARARQLGIPVIRHVWLARTLYATCKPDTEVPRASYEAVAYVYAVVHEMMALGVPPAQREAELESRGEPPPSARGEMA
ncbi:type III secretion protein U [Pseudoduganella flava]|uniref:EscU/YscU/HrcU family type III secretion system export apparatus switch protein n=1 Tax=Pseudoduganella flava TaxID=871742 RepID=A0A562PER1_9BURK|nr:type III secretion system export apparatus subunit SctU [Pseudoduganella flava]QGZ42141.1 EscU/YscU/HrcU family type III secretion system export apparatus switch protein [Pseudoduganella flava]TWI42486.1 type III secretion protein U [Pseudoduganella flava]